MKEKQWYKLSIERKCNYVSRYIFKRIHREKIFNIRKDNNLSVDNFAKAINVTNRTVKAWEAGNNIPTLHNIVGICNNFHVTLESFILYK